MTGSQDTTRLPGVDALTATVVERIRAGDRFVGLFGTARPLVLTGDQERPTVDEPITLSVVTANDAGVHVRETEVRRDYPSLTEHVPSAFWYERVLHDMFGVVPVNHPRLDPLVLPLRHGLSDIAELLPRPGSLSPPQNAIPDEASVPRRVHGPGMFTIPHGPVRSGVMESVEFLVETPGEDIPHVQVRVFAKHRGIERSFQGRMATDGVLLAERSEGISGIAHALAFSHALESVAEVCVPEPATWVRVLHAELERIANHLDAAMKLADAAGLAVAVARFAHHKERLLRLRHLLAGNRFARGVVVPGGVTGLPKPLDPSQAKELRLLERDIASDSRHLMSTSSFLDRIRGTGVLNHELARRLAALGPVARGSGVFDDARVSRPYDGYADLPVVHPSGQIVGDAQARTEVRWHEVEESFALVWAALERLPQRASRAADLRCHVPALTGQGVGWAESAQGEVVYVVDMVEGRIARCWPRSASFHNLSLFWRTFNGDVLTDFAFIEASFGISIAGVVM